MPIAKTSKRQPRNSKLQSQNTNRARTTRLGDELAKGLKQAAAHFRGELKLPSYTYNIPGRIDVRAVRAYLTVIDRNPRAVQRALAAAIKA
jgi:hypothetical protein